jgi:hypothetical protein
VREAALRGMPAPLNQSLTIVVSALERRDNGRVSPEPFAQPSVQPV